MRSLLKNRKAFTAMSIALVVGLVALAVIIPIGVLIANNLNTAITDAVDTPSYARNGSWTIEQNVTDDVFSNVWTAFSLSALVPIIAVAGLLIAIVIGAFALKRMRG